MLTTAWIRLAPGEQASTASSPASGLECGATANVVRTVSAHGVKIGRLGSGGRSHSSSVLHTLLLAGRREHLV